MGRLKVEERVGGEHHPPEIHQYKGPGGQGWGTKRGFQSCPERLWREFIGKEVGILSHRPQGGGKEKKKRLFPRNKENTGVFYSVWKRITKIPQPRKRMRPKESPSCCREVIGPTLALRPG